MKSKVMTFYGKQPVRPTVVK